MVADGFQTEGMHPPYVLSFKNQILCQEQDGHLGHIWSRVLSSLLSLRPSL